MKRMLIILFMLAINALPVLAEPTNASGPWGVDANGFKNLSTALTSPSTSGKTIVISKPMTINNKTLPNDRHIKIIRSGRIDTAFGKTFNFNGQIPEAGIFQIFGGNGTIAGLKSTYPEWHGDTTTDLGATINKVLAAVINGGSVELTKSDYPSVTTIKFPEMSSNIRLFSKNSSSITKVGTGDCIDIAAKNENYGWHTIEGINLIGPNNYYAKVMAASKGAGIRIQRSDGDTSNVATAYNTVIRDCVIQGFKYGIRIRSAIKTRVEGKTFIRFNNYGVYFDGGQSNSNNFIGCVIRLNDTAGVYSAGTTGGDLTNATNNVFSGCLIESNHPYGSTGGTAIYLNNSYDFIFDGCYSESHRYGIHLTNGSKGNKFINHRNAPGPAGNDTIFISGATTWGNIFSGCKSVVLSNKVANVITDNAGQLFNQFLDCEGYNFIPESIVKMPYIRNMIPIPGNVYGGSGTINMPHQGFLNNIGEGTTAGNIEGIGTATAILHCGGFGELSISDQVAAARTNTSIIQFEGLQPGQLFVLWNYQARRSVTVKHGGMTSSIVLKGAADAVMNDYGQMIVFYVTGYGRAYEIGRNF